MKRVIFNESTMNKIKTYVLSKAVLTDNVAFVEAVLAG